MGHTSAVNSVVVSSDLRYIVSASMDTTIRVWEFETGKEIKSLIGHEKAVYSVVITSDVKYILSGSEDSTIKVWSCQYFA